MKDKVGKEEETEEMRTSFVDNITAFALARLVAWEIGEHDFNSTYNPISYPIFSILWLYFRIGKELTIQIKNGKICEVKPNFSHD